MHAILRYTYYCVSGHEHIGNCCMYTCFEFMQVHTYYKKAYKLIVFFHSSFTYTIWWCMLQTVDYWLLLQESGYCWVQIVGIYPYHCCGGSLHKAKASCSIAISACVESIWPCQCCLWNRNILVFYYFSLYIYTDVSKLAFFPNFIMYNA